MSARRAARRPVVLTVLAAAAAVTLAACGSDSGGDEEPSAATEAAVGAADGARFPEIVAVEATSSGDRTYDFAVTVSSPYDTPERYADGWRVLTADGDVLGEWTLLHDHAGEQPFTRTQTGVSIPNEIGSVVIEGRDLENGYGGETFPVDLP